MEKHKIREKIGKILRFNTIRPFSFGRVKENKIIKTIMRIHMRQFHLRHLITLIIASVIVLIVTSKLLTSPNPASSYSPKSFELLRNPSKVSGDQYDPVLSGISAKLPNGQSIVVNRNSSLFWIGGMPRSGTTLMRVLLDTHPNVRCGEETRVIPRILSIRENWKKSAKEWSRLMHAGLSEKIIDNAVASFILEIIGNHGTAAKNLCNKDPFTMRYAKYIQKLFPNSKMIFMVRDGRATVHSIIQRKVTITGFNLSSYRESMIKWNRIVETMYNQCRSLTEEYCLPVFYEELVLQPTRTMKKVLRFLNIDWSENVLKHEQLIGTKISLSKVERSSDQVVKPINLDGLTHWVDDFPKNVLAEIDTIAPMMKRLGYDIHNIPPHYGLAEEMVKNNTLRIKKQREYWAAKAKNNSIHAMNDPFAKEFDSKAHMLPLKAADYIKNMSINSRNTDESRSNTSNWSEIFLGPQ
ncbi:hypothetical protein SNEBB_001344 [Seison nebaliae]|nr:hypothetical protein SNEBB_001344 [Seison nebaliae]